MVAHLSEYTGNHSIVHIKTFKKMKRNPKTINMVLFQEDIFMC